MKVEILICTYNEGINQATNVLLPYRKDITYKISHQITDEQFKSIPQELSRLDVEISQIYSKGLSINRNNTLAMAKGEICFIADDDVTYTFEYIDFVIDYFKKHKETDILIGKISTGEKEYKQYKSKSYHISWSNIGSISSIEMVFRRKSVIDAKIQFDLKFGLGSEFYNRGEEVVFISDCLKSNLTIYYTPHYIVNHPYESTGKKIIFDIKEAQYWGSLFWRVFGFYAYILMFPLALKLFIRYRKTLSIWLFLKNYIYGIKVCKIVSVPK